MRKRRTTASSAAPAELPAVALGGGGHRVGRRGLSRRGRGPEGRCTAAGALPPFDLGPLRTTCRFANISPALGHHDSDAGGARACVVRFAAIFSMNARFIPEQPRRIKGSGSGASLTYQNGTPDAVGLRDGLLWAAALSSSSGPRSLLRFLWFCGLWAWLIAWVTSALRFDSASASASSRFASCLPLLESSEFRYCARLSPEEAARTCFVPPPPGP